MANIVVVGGGFAGVWAAAAAARVRRQLEPEDGELSISLISPLADMVIRPRLYEPAPGQMSVPLKRVLEPIGVEHIAATASSIDHRNRRLLGDQSDDRTLDVRFDQLVVATGSELVHPDIDGAEYLYDVDTLAGAVTLENHLLSLDERAQAGRYTAVVVGSGFTGIEVSTELVARLRAVAAEASSEHAVRVVLVEAGSTIANTLGAGPRPVIERALRELGIETRVSCTVRSVADGHVELTTGEQIAAATVVWTAGMRAQQITDTLPGERDRFGRLPVDDNLRVTDAPGILAAGDTAAAEVEGGHLAMQSCQHANAMGRIAGHNAAAGLYGLEQHRFEPEPYVTCLDLGAAGAVFTRGFERRVELTGQPAKEKKRTINRAIYPPTDDADAILSAANPAAASRVPTSASVA